MKPIRDTLSLCAAAGEMLKAVGFEVAFPSMTTTTVYYRWPDRQHLLRVSEHGGKPPRGVRGPVVSRLTFKGCHTMPEGQMALSDGKLEVMVAGAIGRYFLRSSSL